MAKRNVNIKQAAEEEKDAVFTTKTFFEPPYPFFVPDFQSCYNYKDEINPKEGEIQLHAKSTNKANYERGIDGGSVYSTDGYHCIRSYY
ncbi:hypothetical protein [Planococcus halotolerans]|uniref:hypothetical protein n=1 Tax=Planococcus halotolerans TaxID=2233542 RepID=UPI001402A680|nr:hypothetical protein [Planococcus halotolerans]